MIDKKIVYEINKLADLLHEIKIEGDKYPNLAEVGKKVLIERIGDLEKELEELKKI